MRATLRPAVAGQFLLDDSEVLHVPLRSMVIFSGELVLGPIHCQLSNSRQAPQNHTDGADNAGTAVHLLGLVVGVEARLPFQLGAVIEMSESVRHLEAW
jgi:hypothetical protein